MYSKEYINSLTHTGVVMIIVVMMMEVFAIALSPLKLLHK
jgi:ABC-type maltose transport system permease subunit